ncbi:MAG: EF-P lysine aminoacylase EpmA [Steroidobacteraceae bacterium]
MDESWRPVASRDLLQRRASLLAQVRTYFVSRDVLEVTTPALINAPASDPQIHSLRVADAGWLQTSPEYAMKRLLAAGSGDIFQICPVFRGAERSRLHNPEFTLIEWYRLGYNLERLMRETAQLVQELLGTTGVEFLSYEDAFTRELQCDPLGAPDAQLGALARAAGLDLGSATRCSRDELLDFLIASVIGPRLGHGALTCLHRYPASQASLAQLDPQDSRVALRFELYARGVELANGFVELADAHEQAARFSADLALRAQRGLPVTPLDQRLIAALGAGLPECAGVALGFDRLLMLATGAASIDAVLAFPSERA